VTLKLLVADDHPGYRLLVRTALRSSHVEIVGEVGDVASMERAADELRPDAALVDLLLPGGGGFAAAQALHDKAPSCAAVVSSAYAIDELVAAGDIGGVAFLSKGVSPFRLAEELTSLVAVLERTEPAIDEATIRLPPERSSAGDARRFLDQVLLRWGCQELGDAVKLLVTELVANAVLHARTDIEVTVRLLSDTLRLEVADRSPAHILRREATSDDTSGRGSELIDIMSRAWGLIGKPDGKCIWFELDLPETREVRT
jgi:DNA-binding NarL/FixJ family response regulator